MLSHVNMCPYLYWNVKHRKYYTRISSGERELSSMGTQKLDNVRYVVAYIMAVDSLIFQKPVGRIISYFPINDR